MTDELLEASDSPLYTDSTGDLPGDLARRASLEIDVSRQARAAPAAR